MNFLREKFQASAEYARIAPLFIYVCVGAGDLMGGDWKFWSYMLKVFVGAWVLWQARPFVQEMRWAFSWEAVVVGVLVFIIWIGLDPYYPKINLLFKDTPESIWNPFDRFGQASAVSWILVCIRIAGMTIVVPPLEEIFYRSLLYRYFVRTDFQNMPFKRFHPTSFIVTSSIFGLVHYQWLAGILCGMAFQGLVIRKNRLGDAMTAHAITNFLLGIWVVWKGGIAWKFF
jgi:CAAX prenyl protease-like protein